MCISMAAASLIATVVSTGVSIIGQQQAASAQQSQNEYQQAVFRNQQIVIAQDQKTERERERVRQRLLAQEGRERKGDIRVGQAGLGQLVDEGSALDITRDLAAEVEYKKLLSKHESDLRIRNLGIQSSNIGADIGLLSLQSRDTRRAANTKSFSTILTAGSNISRKFKFGEDGKFVQFRT